MKLIALTTALVVAASAPAFANAQLARSLGVEPGTLTTAQLAQVKAVVDHDDDNRTARALIERFSAGEVSTMGAGVSAGHAQLAANLGVDPAQVSVSEIASIRALVDHDDDNRAVEAAIDRVRDGGVVSTMSTGVSAGHAQLAASLGLDPAEYSFSQVVDAWATYDPTDPTN